jgi:hypothetical protein
MSGVHFPLLLFLSFEHSWNVLSKYLSTVLISVPRCCQIFCTEPLVTRWQSCWLNRMFVFICMSWTQQLRHLNCLFGGRSHMTQSTISWLVLPSWMWVSFNTKEQSFFYSDSYSPTNFKTVEWRECSYMSLYTPQANSVSIIASMQDWKGDRSLIFEPLMFKAIVRAVEPVPRHQVQLAEGAQLWFSELSVYVNFPVNNSVSATFQYNMLCMLRQMLQTASHCGQLDYFMSYYWVWNFCCNNNRFFTAHYTVLCGD